MSFVPFVVQNIPPNPIAFIRLIRVIRGCQPPTPNPLRFSVSLRGLRGKKNTTIKHNTRRLTPTVRLNTHQHHHPFVSFVSFVVASPHPNPLRFSVSFRVLPWCHTTPNIRYHPVPQSIGPPRTTCPLTTDLCPLTSDHRPLSPLHFVSFVPFVVQNTPPKSHRIHSSDSCHSWLNAHTPNPLRFSVSLRGLRGEKNTTRKTPKTTPVT